MALMVFGWAGCDGAMAQGRIFEAYFGYAQMTSNSGVSLFSDIQSAQTIPTVGLSLGWPVSDHATLGVSYRHDFCSFGRQTFSEEYALNRLCCEMVGRKNIGQDITCMYGFSLGPLMACNTVNIGELTDSYRRYGIVGGPKLGVGYNVGNTRFGLTYECFAGAFLSKVYEAPQGVALPVAGGRSYWGHSLMLTILTNF